MNGDAIFAVLVNEDSGDMQKFGEDSTASYPALKIAKADQTDICDDAFADLVRRQSQFVFKVAFSVLRNVHDAEDTTQETFLKLYRLGSWRGIDNERAFLARVAWRLAVSSLPGTTAQELPAELKDDSKDNESNLIKQNGEAILHRLMDSLPQELRLPLALSTIDGMSSPDIAQVMGIPEGTVRTRLMRARQTLKRKLEEHSITHG